LLSIFHNILKVRMEFYEAKKVLSSERPDQEVLTWPIDLPLNIGNTNLQSPDTRYGEVSTIAP